MNPEDLLRELKDPDRWMQVRVPRARRPAVSPTMPPARIAQLVVAFAIAVLAIAGLLAGLGALPHRAAPAATSAPSRTSAAIASLFTVVPGRMHEYSAGHGPAVCTARQLQTESKQDGGGAAGSYHQEIAVRNTGADCLLPADSIRVGGAVAPFTSTGGARGLVLPTAATGRLDVSAPSACQPSGTTSNLDPTKPVLPIALRTDESSRTLKARFPGFRCTQPVVDAELDPTAATRFPSALPGLEAEIDGPPTVVGRDGTLAYAVVLRDTGTTALELTSCPTATEVLSDGRGAVVTRSLTLRCALGSTLQPDVPVRLDVTATGVAQGTWAVQWFLGGGSGTTAASTTCSLAQLRVSEPGPGGGEGGNWVQLVTVRDLSAACVLPVSAFSVDSRPARAGTASVAHGIRLSAGSTVVVTVAAATTCANGDITSIHSFGPEAKPIVLTLHKVDANGLDQPFPQLHCAAPFVGVER